MKGEININGVDLILSVLIAGGFIFNNWLPLGLFIIILIGFGNYISE